MRLLRPLLGGALIAVLLSFVASPADAAGEVATRVSIDPLETVTVGTEASLVVTLAQEDGVAVVDEPIALAVDGTSRPRRWTDAAGVATFHLPRDLPPGEYEVVATYAGRTDRYLGASARIVVDIVPYELAVETVPPLPGMVFEVDGTRFEAGADGVARVGLDRLGDHTLTALTTEYRHPGQRVEFSRWSNETFGPTINIRAPLEVSLQAGFDLSFQAFMAFRDPHGNPVDPERIDEVTLRNSIGTEVTHADGRPRWYKAIRTIRRPAGLDHVPIRYTVERVIVDGTNVVNVGQQRFDVEPAEEWQIDLLLYSVRMVPNDALLGYPLGESVILTYPSGSRVRIDAVDGEFTADGLARGLYRVQVADAPGWSPVTPIALSRDQEVRVRVITYVDIAVVVLTGMGIALGLLHLGRPHLAWAAMAGARVVLGVARNPRTIGALMVGRREPARPATETAPLATMARDFVLPPVRADRSSADRAEAPYAPSTPTPRRGAVPIAQVIRTTLGSPLPANRTEASALPSPPVLAHPPALDAPAQGAPPVPLVFAPRMAVADAPTPGAAEPSGAPARHEAASTPLPAVEEPRLPGRVRSRDGATATPRSAKAKRVKGTPSDAATTAGSASGRGRRRSTKASPDPSSVPEPETRPVATKSSSVGALGKRAGAPSETAASRTSAVPRKTVRAGAKRGAAPADAAGPSRSKTRAARASEGASKETTAPAERPSKARSAKKAAPAERASKARSAKKAASTERASKATAESVTERPSKARSAKKAASTERPSKARSAKKAASTERPSKARSAKKAASTERPSKARSAKKAAPAERASKARSTKKTAPAERPTPARFATAPASPPDAVTSVQLDAGASDLAANPEVGTPPMPSQTSSPIGARIEAADVSVSRGESGAGDPNIDEVSTVASFTTAHGLLGVRPHRDVHPAVEPRRFDGVGTGEPVATPLPPMTLQQGRPTSPRATALECAGCRADLKPGARYCRRCGRATPVGELEREALS